MRSLMRTPSTSLASILVAGCTLIAAAPTTAAAQQPAATPSAQAQPSAQQAASQRQFSSDAGFILNFVKADKTGDFEAVIAKLKEALQKSDKPERKQQAAGWKIFKGVEPGPNGSVLYVFIMDPAVKGADYTVTNILNEAFPQEVQELYKQYTGSFASGQNIVNLSKLSSMGQP